MNYKSLAGLTCFLLSGYFSLAQDYPRNYFSAPLDTPLILSGTFGEVRPDHLHSGIDISTDGMEGLPVMAAADGYISRIKISAGGFGKALYVTHPNGFVSVYGHLQKFTAPVNELCRKTQYEKQQFEIEIFPKSREYKVKKGELIAYSGNSGASSAPHLHFEIRDELTEEPINPLLFGLKIKDSMAPEIRNIRVFPLSEAGILNHTDTAITYEIQNIGGVVSLNTPDLIYGYGFLGVGFEAVDKQFPEDESNLGIYQAEVVVDRQVIYSWKMDRFNFSETRSANSHADYLSRHRDRINIEKAFKDPGNELKIYPDTNLTGLIHLEDDDAHDVTIKVSDFNGHSSQFEFIINGKSSLANKNYQPHPTGALRITPSKGAAIRRSNIEITVPPAGVFDLFYLYDSETESKDYLSSIFKVGDAYVAINNPVNIAIKPKLPIPAELKSKALIVRLEEYGSKIALGGEWRGEFLQANTRKFGNFAILLDTVPPVLTKEYVPADMNSYRGGLFQVRVSDDLSGIKSYSGTIDGKWHLYEYDAKNQILTADLSALPSNKEHHAELTVADERGNITTWKYSFWF